MTPSDPKSSEPAPPTEPKVYLLPNLMTAGNLFCGFMAVLQIVEGWSIQYGGGANWEQRYIASIYWIFGAFLFDLLDGRLARLGGQDSPFGREFDSLADLISFGIAPALLIFQIVLAEFPHRLGWIIAFLYLLCGALRLARFNVVASMGHAKTDAFTGFPIPAAAGVICSITLFLLYLYENEANLGRLRYLLPVLMIFLSLMMFSRVNYPSFKTLSWRTKRTVPVLIAVVLIMVLVVLYSQVMLMVIFLTYLLYGFFRPTLSWRLRREIEDVGADAEDPQDDESRIKT